MPGATKTKHFTVRFEPEASAELKELSENERVSAAELVRRAISFYKVRIEAKKHNKRIFLENEGGEREWVMI